ncbi:hypothetical protein T02_11651 [Trichinella nativa]|uniref:Uncharacterized protein n=1 Tax=Trichinella nativa TaxID=6335 RepID=A0A0V1KKE5_9BILA|nr:hypothetical protein T02_10780 [Trichinella nativa]KRZ48148.1 hypothetical protein T02_11651 [Trichinella nativa]
MNATISQSVSHNTSTYCMAARVTAGTDFNNTIGEKGVQLQKESDVVPRRPLAKSSPASSCWLSPSHGLFSSLAFRRVWQWANHGAFMHGSALFPRDRDIHNMRSAVFDQYKVMLVYVTP